MKIKNLKLFGAALSGMLSVTALTGCAETPPMYYEEVGCEFTNQFDVGEHIISVPLEEDIRERPMQIEAHPGYEVVGISISAYGSSSYYGGGVVIYANDEVVECRTSVYDRKGNYVYREFGTPLDYVEENIESNGGAKEFGVGEHIISIPLEDDVREDNTQYEYHEGYEVIGISAAAYGSSSYYGGGVILYKNSVPVKANYNEEGYTAFGKPIVEEQEKEINTEEKERSLK